MLGDAVVEAIRGTTEINADKLAIGSTRVTLSSRLPTMEVWNETRRRLKVFTKQSFQAGLSSKYRTLLGNVRDMIERGEAPKLQLDINAVTLGSEWCLVAFQHELFAEYELWVDENAPFDHTMVFAYTNGVWGYVATDAELALGEKGGYEAGAFPCFWAHSVQARGTSLAVGAEKMIKEAAASLWTG